MKNVMYWISWVISALPILLMLMGAGMGLSGNPQAIEGFKKTGYPEGVLIPIIVVELICIVLYLIPQTSVLGAVLLTGYLGGAVATHVRVGEPFYLPLAVGALLWLGLMLRDPALRKLFPFRS